MSGHGSPDLQIQDQPGLRVAIVAAYWHQQVMDGLVAGARRACAEAGVEDPTLVRVPGSFREVRLLDPQGRMLAISRSALPMSVSRNFGDAAAPPDARDEGAPPLGEAAVAGNRMIRWSVFSARSSARAASSAWIGSAPSTSC